MLANYNNGNNNGNNNCKIGKEIVFSLVGFSLLWFLFQFFPSCLLDPPPHVNIISSSTGSGLLAPPPRIDHSSTALNSTSNNYGVNDVIVQHLLEATTKDRLMGFAEKYKEQYAAAKPFPHIALDGIFPESVINALMAEIPEGEGCVNPPKCKMMANATLKSYIDKEALMGPYTRLVFSILRSDTFSKFLAELSGIGRLIPDPGYKGSGVHVTSRGGFLNIHADFNRLRYYELDRRVNAFVFLNNDWKEEYGGHLELWGQDMKSCYQRILPTAGRFVAFSTTDFSYHGHPQPLTSPQGRSRRSLAFYYYTNGRPSSECLGGDCSGNKHSTLYQIPEGCKECTETACARFDPSFMTANV